MQLSEQLGRAELNTMDSDVDSLAFSLAILNPETSVLQWEWHVHSEHLAICDPSNNLPALELSNTSSCAYLGLLAEVPLLSGGLCVLNDLIYIHCDQLSHNLPDPDPGFRVTRPRPRRRL
ncbi:PREDICTED: dual specificity protein phosphatase 14 isoform X2 [Myotis brandtii]|uniref:dual specificity protein phosphatase 14 isoform X2 n=1 Tax=Myotis brandtii TaxID=109478 RepID=UPI00070450E2|nr:PREDICTED: dual specificity protein phosphatase 14 isoform X2 [Myotis brandtii]